MAVWISLEQKTLLDWSQFLSQAYWCPQTKSCMDGIGKVDTCLHYVYIYIVYLSYQSTSVLSLSFRGILMCHGCKMHFKEEPPPLAHPINMHLPTDFQSVSRVFLQKLGCIAKTAWLSHQGHLSQKNVRGAHRFKRDSRNANIRSLSCMEPSAIQ